MKKFKTFYSESDKNCSDVANEWFEQHPDAEILDFKYQRKQGAWDGICVLYEAPEKIGERVEMLRSYDYMENRTIYTCPKCKLSRMYPGNTSILEPTCPECLSGRRRIQYGATADPLLR